MIDTYSKVYPIYSQENDEPSHNESHRDIISFISSTGPIEGSYLVGLPCMTFCHPGLFALISAQRCSSWGTNSPLPASMQRSTSGRRWLSSTVGPTRVPKVQSSSEAPLCLRCSMISAKMACRSARALATTAGWKATALVLLWLNNQESQWSQQRTDDKNR